ncbi:hypothetical protein ACWEVD_30710 [Nocardia thailandica]|uniref:DUF4190 domain-containing protein n=1 Tax=Nocardia thailandica TaxID=257275 RepID=A0ABW6PMM0_9NOCA
MARYDEWDDDPEEGAEDRRWNGQRWPHAEPRDPGAEAPRVNPFAMVALAAALVALFPIAIVFALLSFGHPKGRGSAVLALLLGIAEAAAVAVAVLSFTDVLDLPLPPAAAGPSNAVQALGSPASTHATSTGAPAPVVPGPTPASTAAVVSKGTACEPEQAGLIGVNAEGATLLCLKSSGGYRWSGPLSVPGSFFVTGTACDPQVSRSGRTAEGRAVVCEGKAGNATWVPWTSE